jgi:type I restriction enzyme S subunit
LVKISQEHIKDWWIPVPSLLEQQRIVDYLARRTIQIDEVCSSTERTIALLKERRSALIAAAVTGRIPLSELMDNDRTREDRPCSSTD